MKTSFRTCPACGGKLWIRWHLYQRPARAHNEADPETEVVPVEWNCERECELEEAQVRRAMDQETVRAASS